MAWVSPLTAVNNVTLTAAQWNASVRDNLNETAPAKATAANRWFVTTGANAIVERAISSGTVNTSQTTASTSYTDLTTIGPDVTLTTGTQAMVFLTCQLTNNASSSSALAAFAVSGATTFAADDDQSVYFQQPSGSTNIDMRATALHKFTSATAGSNTFRMKYRVGGGTGTFQRRQVCVMGL